MGDVEEVALLHQHGPVQGREHHPQVGVPNMDPAGLATRSHAEYKQAGTLEEMIKEDLVAERVAIETYNEIARWLGTNDITSRRVIENILAKEEEHANDLSDLLAKVRT